MQNYLFAGEAGAVVVREPGPGVLEASLRLREWSCRLPDLPHARGTAYTGWFVAVRELILGKATKLANDVE